MNPEHFGRRYSITVCMDGHVSIIDTREGRKQRRLGSALPVFTVDQLSIAFELIRRLCTLSRCAHGGKTGTLLEPRVNGWPNEATLEDLERVTGLFELEYEKLKELGVT
jgi:hypothetical protein